MVKRKAECKVEKNKGKVEAMRANWNPQGQTATCICLSVHGTPNCNALQKELVSLQQRCTYAQPRTQTTSGRGTSKGCKSQEPADDQHAHDLPRA